MAPPEQVGHVCLAGHKVCDDWALIRELKARHHVTLMRRVDVPSDGSLLATAQVLVLDCGEPGEADVSALPLLRQQHPVLTVLLVDGGLSQRQVVEAFREGIRDYFPDPYDGHLLAERVGWLCARRPGQGPPESGG